MKYKTIDSLLEALESGTEFKIQNDPVLNTLPIIAKMEKNDPRSVYSYNGMSYQLGEGQHTTPIRASTLDLKNFLMFLLGNIPMLLNREFSFSSQQYLDFCCKQTNSASRKQLKEDLATLDSIIFSGSSKIGGDRTKLFQSVRLFEDARYERGVVTVEFSLFFQSYL